MKKRKPFRIRKGYWIALCTPCRKIVHSYRRGGWGDLFGPLKCDRCGDEADVEFYPLFAEHKPASPDSAGDGEGSHGTVVG